MLRSAISSADSASSSSRTLLDFTVTAPVFLVVFSVLSSSLYSSHSSFLSFLNDKPFSPVFSSGLSPPNPTTSTPLFRFSSISGLQSHCISFSATLPSNDLPAKGLFITIVADVDSSTEAGGSFCIPRLLKRQAIQLRRLLGLSPPNSTTPTPLFRSSSISGLKISLHQLLRNIPLQRPASEGSPLHHHCGGCGFVHRRRRKFLKWASKLTRSFSLGFGESGGDFVLAFLVVVAFILPRWLLRMPRVWVGGDV